MNETHIAVFCCLDNSYSLRRFLRIVFVFSWVNFLSKHTLCVPHVGSKLKKKKSYNSFAVNKMMTDLGCFVITEGHVSAVIITTIVFNFFQGSANLPSSRKLWTASQQCFQHKDDPIPHWEFKDDSMPILCTIMHLQMGSSSNNDSKGLDKRSNLSRISALSTTKRVLYPLCLKPTEKSHCHLTKIVLVSFRLCATLTVDVMRKESHFFSTLHPSMLCSHLTFYIWIQSSISI